MSELFEERPEIQPVWQVIPQFFRYPFKRDVLPSLILISLGSALTLIPFFGFFVWLMLWAMLFKISYEILTSTAAGHMEGPPSVTDMSGGIMFKHIGLLLAIVITYVFVINLLGSVLMAVLLGLFVLLALPAAMMTLAMTQSLIEALNPVTWVRIMRITGLAYLLTSVFLLLMTFSQAQVESWLLPAVGNSLLLFNIVSWFITAYFMAASFHLMGYLLYQHHDELGIEATGAGLSEETAANEPPPIAEAAELVREGRADEAAKMLGRTIEHEGAEPAVHEYYRKLLANRNDHEALAEHARQYIPMLIHAQENIDRAVDVAEESLQARPGLELNDPSDRLPLARRAFERNRHALVLKLASGFGKRHPRHPDLPELYFLAAQSLIEEKGDNKRAVGTVRQLLNRFPDHPLAEDMQRFEQSFAP